MNQMKGKIIFDKSNTRLAQICMILESQWQETFLARLLTPPAFLARPVILRNLLALISLLQKASTKV